MSVAPARVANAAPGYSVTPRRTSSRAGGPLGSERSSMDSRAIVGLTLVVVTGLVLLAATGNPVLALAPMLATLAVRQLRRVRLTQFVYLLLIGVIAADMAPRLMPGSTVDTWKPPLYPLMGLLLDNLNSTFGISALHFSGTEVLLAAMLIALLARRFRATASDGDPQLRVPQPLVLAFAVELATILVLEILGVARGGDVRQSLWQFRQLVWLPVIVVLLTHAVRGPRGPVVMMWVVTFTACLKSIVGMYYYYRIAAPAGYQPPTVTSHADTVLYVGTLMMWVAVATARPTRARVLGAVFIGAWMIDAIIINNRRTAYVSIAVSVLLLVVLLPRRQRRRIVRIALYCAPLIAGYLRAGAHHSGGIFGPAAKISSVTTQKDESSLTRDVENFNLMETLRPHALLGSGWGHEYVEAVRADDISGFYKQYRFIAHNSVLWLWSIGGVLGFSGLWLPLPIGVYLADRSRHLARTYDERAAAYAALLMYLVFMMLAWADMGVGSWTAVFLLGCAFAVTARLTAATNAWPATAHLFRQIPRIPEGDWTRRGIREIALARGQHA